MGQNPDQFEILKSFLGTKPTIKNPFYLKRLNSQTHYILWWDEHGEFCHVHKSRGKSPVLEMASMVVDTDTEDYIKWYMKKEYLLYSDVKLHFSGKLIL